MRQSLEPAGSENDDPALKLWQKLCQCLDEGGLNPIDPVIDLFLKDADGQTAW